MSKSALPKRFFTLAEFLRPFGSKRPYGPSAREAAGAFWRPRGVSAGVI